jgi:dATP/dGTP diphosphohydrolase
MSVQRTTVAERKALPVASGVLDYFPDALLAVAEVSRVGNEQHHPGQPLHWDKSKSTDEADALMRHLIDRGTLDIDGLRHTAKVAWRALALLQRELDAEQEALDDDRCICHVGRWPLAEHKKRYQAGTLGPVSGFLYSPIVQTEDQRWQPQEPLGAARAAEILSTIAAPHTGTPVCYACGYTPPDHDLGCLYFGWAPGEYPTKRVP